MASASIFVTPTPRVRVVPLCGGPAPLCVGPAPPPVGSAPPPVGPAPLAIWPARFHLAAALLAAVLIAALPGEALAIEQGDVIFSELLIRSSAASEWIELFNTTSTDVDLSACDLTEGGAQVPLTDLVIPADGFALLGSGASCVVFDSSGSCVRAVDLDYGVITLNDSTPETLSLLCEGAVVVDEVVYDNAVFAADCTGTGGTCSVNLDPAAMNGSANDDWTGNWCVPPVTAFVYDELGLESVSTPGAPNQCHNPGPSCGLGDVLFTELMIDAPDSSDSVEWIEMLVVGGGSAGCDLHGCVLQEGPFAEITADNVTHEDWSAHVIDAPGNSLLLTQGQYALFAKGSAAIVASSEDGAESYPATYNYSGISFGNSEPGYLHLVCDGVPLDSVPYDWDRVEPACLGTHCSVNLYSGNESGEANDDLGSWCLPPLDQDWISSHADGLTFQGTPGQPGRCQQRDWPAADQLVFTELMISPHRSSEDGAPQFAEWFELHNPGTSEFELSGCKLLRERYDDEGGLLVENTQSTFVGTEQSQPVLLAGETRVFSKGCLLSGDDPTDEEPVGCEEGEYTYKTISLTDGTRESLSLVCPDGTAGEVLIDLAGYDMTRTGNRKGRTMQFDPAVLAAGADNADPYQWCEASLQQDIPTLFTSDGEYNYGTPGAVAPCAVGNVDLPDSGPGCRCSTGASPSRGSAALLLIALGGLPLLRRRLR